MAVRNFLSFLSLLGSRRPPLPAHKWSASQASHAAARGLSWGTLSGLSQAERGVRVSPPPRPPLALPAAPHAHPTLGRGDPTGIMGPCRRLALLPTGASRPPRLRALDSCFPYRSSRVGVPHLTPLAVGCPSCRFIQKQSFCHNS